MLRSFPGFVLTVMVIPGCSAVTVVKGSTVEYMVTGKFPYIAGRSWFQLIPRPRLASREYMTEFPLNKIYNEQL